MGVFEIEGAAKGTLAVASALADATAHGAVTVVGEGDSVSAIERSGLARKVTHVSTGGGASLELVEGKDLPGAASSTRSSLAGLAQPPCGASASRRFPTECRVVIRSGTPAVPSSIRTERRPFADDSAAARR
jgi:hypothetical protein